MQLISVVDDAVAGDMECPFSYILGLLARFFLVVIVTDLSLLLKTNILDSILIVATSRASKRHVELPFFFKKDSKWRAENLPKLKFKQPL